MVTLSLIINFLTTLTINIQSILSCGLYNPYLIFKRLFQQETIVKHKFSRAKATQLKLFSL